MIYGTFVFGYDADTPACLRSRRAICPRAITVHRQFQPADADAGYRALRPPAPAKAACCAPSWWIDPSISVTAMRSSPAGHAPERTQRRADAGAPRLLWLALDRSARRARRADVARSIQDRNHAARQLDLAPRDRAQAGTAAGVAEPSPRLAEVSCHEADAHQADDRPHARTASISMRRAWSRSISASWRR